MFFTHRGASPEVDIIKRSSHFPSSENKLFPALPVDSTHGVTKRVGGDFVHLLCIYSSTRKAGFTS